MVKIFASGILIVLLILIIDMCRRQKLTFQYAFGWLMFALLGLMAVIFEPSVEALSHWCGFIVTSNFIFFCLMVFFIVLSLFLTTFLCQQNKRNDIMAQKIAILDLELKELKKDITRAS